jgi:TolB-like protein
LFLAELKRRKVYHVAVVYMVVGLGILGAAEVILDPLGLGSLRKYIVILVLLGFPIALVLAWAYEVRPEEPGRADAGPRPTSEAPDSEWKESIVVLPFDNMSPDAGDSYFCDGLTEEIIARLSHIRSLRVISRNSAMVLKGTLMSTKAIAEELEVQYVLEGSVRKAGENLRITAQLIDAFADNHIWSENYEGTLEDVFSIQETVSRLIADALDLTLSSDERAKLSERPIADVHAYECHLRAKYEIFLATKDSLDRAKQLILNGLNLIGDNEVLYSDLGLFYSTYYEFVSKDDTGLSDAAQDCVEKVFSLNPESSHGYFLRGRVHLMHAEIQEAARDFKKAVGLDPNNVNALLRLAWVYAHVGHTVAARPLIRRGLEIDPLTPVNHMIAGGVEWMDGRFDAGREHIKRAHELESAVPFFRYWYGRALAYTGRFEEAYRLFEMIERDTPDIIFAWLGRFFRFAHQGDKETALGSVTERLQVNAREDEIYPVWMAENYALIDEREAAIDWLEHVVDFGFINHSFLNVHDPFLEAIRGEERFQNLMERARREQEAFEV